MPAKTCPKCRRLYPEDAQICDDCDQALIDIADHPESDEDLLVLTNVAGQEEAAVLASILKGRGIPAMVEDMTLLSWTTGLTPAAAGGVRVLINAVDAEAALELLRQHQAGELALTDDDVAEADELPDESADDVEESDE